MAAYAGADPGQVRQAMDASRNAWVQGGVLKYLATAHTAMLQIPPDADSAEKALKNAYYYLPDGQELKTDQKGPGGKLQYQDPIKPFIDPKTGTPLDKEAGGVPNMIPVDIAHIQQLGMAMLDPMNVQKTINEVRVSQAQAAQAYGRAQQGIETGKARVMTAGANVTNAETRRLESGSVNARNFGAAAHSLAEADRATALAKGNRNIDPALAREAATVGTEFEKAVQGQLTTDSNPKLADGTPNPNYNKPMRNPAASLLPGATPQETAIGQGLAQSIYVAGGGKVSHGDAMRLAALGVKGQRAGAAGVHKALPNEKSENGLAKNFHVDPDGTVHIWNSERRPPGYEIAHIPPEEAAGALQSGPTSFAPAGSIDTGGGGAPFPAMAPEPGAGDNSTET
ncbi:MAG: hypothetical protein ACHQ9S_18925 [Candidatus Binatia bacterium]